MSVGDILYAISEAGLTLTASKTEDTLMVYPAQNITPELAAAIKEHKADICRCAASPRPRTRCGFNQSERLVFDLAREHFGLRQEGGAV